MINDKLTKSIASAALDIMKESWPDAASTSIYVDKAGKTPISDVEAGSEHEMTDEDANKHAGMAEEDSKLKCSSCGCEDVGDYDGEILCHKCGQDAVTEEDIQEALKKSQPPAEWIHDFVHSKDAKFKGKSKAERINMALGAYYAAQGEVKEGVEEPRAQGEKNFKAAHVIDKKHDVNQDDQSGTEAMGEAKPKLPVGTTPTKGENLDGEVINDEDIKKIKASATSAKAPKATGSKQPGAESAESLKDTTKGGKQSAEAPKASGSKNSGAQSAEKVKNTAPEGKQNAPEPTAKQKGSEPMPKGLKEAALKTLLGEDTIEEGIFDTVKALGKNVAGAVGAKVAAGAQAIQAQLAKAKQEGDAAEVARLQARIAQLQKNQPEAPAVKSAISAEPKADEEKPVTSGASKPQVVYDAAWYKKYQTSVSELPDSQFTSDWIAGFKQRMKSNPSNNHYSKMFNIVQGEIKKRGLKVPTDTASSTDPKPKNVSGAAALAQKAAQSKLAKQSTKQLQATMARIQALLKQRGVTEDVSFNEAFEILGEDAINECMSSFDKQYADDNKKALIQLITGQGTEGIDKKQLTQLNKFISSYGAELKKHLDLPILDDKKEDVKESKLD